MTFKVAARTVLELGAELISSDAVAIYELVKNAIDARSKDGVRIEFCITLRHSDYVDIRAQAEELQSHGPVGDREREAVLARLDELRTAVVDRLLPDAPVDARNAVASAIDSAASPAAFQEALSRTYAESNWIEFHDTGTGMSSDDLLRAFLVIGTPSRRRALEEKLRTADTEPPYLGEKGVGRLSSMRLGSGLFVKTATAEDRRYNLLHIDWSAFEDLEKLVEEIAIEPTTGGRKSSPNDQGTTIKISGLNANWSPRRIREIATFELARLSDPFSRQKRRFRIAIYFNGDRVDIPRLDRAILDLAHARFTGRYTVVDGKPRLEGDLWCGDLGKGNAPEERRVRLEGFDLRSITRDADTEVPASALRTVGPFSFELYWYNRRLLRGVDSIGERRRVLALQEQWSGIMLFRNSYRVFPYGDDDDDWLGLDRRALASGGYKLNKAQFIGRVSISRLNNPCLIDQTNREGLKDCDEKSVLIEILRFVIQNRLRNFIDEVDQRHRETDFDFTRTETRVRTLERRARKSIQELRQRHGDEAAQLRELLTLFEEMSEYFDAAKQRAEQIEDERDRMIQLAGVGLMLEIVAHELARSTEYTMRVLDQANPDTLPADVASTFGTLRDEMKTMNKRLRVLDPLSVSGRQRKETFDMVELVREVLEGHGGQFRRHGVSAKIETAERASRVMINGVRGMFVQILENLIQNSIYWIDLRRQDEDDYKPWIEVRIAEPPQVIDFTDNGPGIQPGLRDEVFKAFFSMKGKNRRQGLGLYIARDCARHHGGELSLSDERRVHEERLNTFVLELPERKQ